MPPVNDISKTGRADQRKPSRAARPYRVFCEPAICKPNGCLK
jgi:hypothetical protein